jgi:hypothetical protein
MALPRDGMAAASWFSGRGAPGEGVGMAYIKPHALTRYLINPLVSRLQAGGSPL